jgi:hypothetical protein
MFDRKQLYIAAICLGLFEIITAVVVAASR